MLAGLDCTTVLVTHDLEEAVTLASDVVVMARGAIAAEAAVAEMGADTPSRVTSLREQVLGARR